MTQVLPGAARPGEYLPLLQGKNIALVANAASEVNGVPTLDTLLAMNLNVRKVFTPEHGFQLTGEAGETIGNIVDSATSIPVISLYGKKKKPEASDLQGMDVVVFDIQDVGVRFFTYISTLTLLMESCAEQDIPLIVFDRPNPNGFYVDGPVLEKEYASFVGMHPVPVVYGMTIGEYARMVNGEGWLADGKQCDLTVVELEGYAHFSQVELPVNPSPNLTSANAIFLYPSLCLFEGTVVSVGRGTRYPFEVIGHPKLTGFDFSFVPEKIPGMSTAPPYLGEACNGLDLRTFYEEKPGLKGRLRLGWLKMMYRNLSGSGEFFNSYFDKLAGNGTLRKQIEAGMDEKEIRATWQPGLNRFLEIREKYLLYP